jgi:single-strand DNA-binding protein
MAQRGINKMTLVGHVGQAPEHRNMNNANGTAVCNVSIATGESWTDKQSGQKVEQTEWHRVVLFGKAAEIVQQLEVRKGSQLYLEGKLKTREWEKDGIKRYTTEIVVDFAQNGVLQLLGHPADSGQRQGGDGGHSY